LGCQQIGNLVDLSRHAGWQLAAQVECRQRPTRNCKYEQVGNLGWQLVSNYFA